MAVRPLLDDTLAERLVELATGFMLSKQLFAASRVGLFEALTAESLTSAQLATRLGLEERVVRILADAMNAIGLVERSKGRYSNTPPAAAHLAGRRDHVDLRPFLAFLNAISYEQWLQFDATVDTGKPGELDLSGSRFGVIAAGTGAFRRLHAVLYGQAVDIADREHLLDLGGMDADFTVELLGANPNLRATLMYEPAAATRMRDALAAAGLEDRAEVVGVETLDATPSAVHDLVTVTHCIHRFEPEQVATILRIARRGAVEGARLLVTDFLLDDDVRQRPIDAAHAAEYLVFDGTVVYPEADVRRAMVEVGWQPRTTLTLPGGPRIIAADAAPVS